MKTLIVLLILQLSQAVAASEYQKMFSCSMSLKNDAQVLSSAVGKNFVALPANHGSSEGVNLFYQNSIYFCKLPAKFITRNIDEKVYKMNLSVPNQKTIFMTYVKSTTEPSTIEAMNLEDSMEARLSGNKAINCSSLPSDAHSEKVLADFLRKEIAQVHDTHASESSFRNESSVESLKLCEKSFLLKSIVDNELKKFGVREPAAAAPEDADIPSIKLDH